MVKYTSTWYLYMIRTPSGQLYTGITTDIDRRLLEHKTGKGSKYLRGKSPLTLVFSQAIGDRSQALKTELAVKKLSKSNKEKLVQGQKELLDCT
ncbi:MAG: GIY-YIG nuclease family protein [Mariprofundaceae bacterium]